MTEHTEKDVLMKCTKCGYDKAKYKMLAIFNSSFCRS